MEVSEELSSDTILQWLDPVTDTDSLLAAVRDIYESTDMHHRRHVQFWLQLIKPHTYIFQTALPIRSTANLFQNLKLSLWILGLDSGQN